MTGMSPPQKQLRRQRQSLAVDVLRRRHADVAAKRPHKVLLRHKPTIDRFAVHKYLIYKIAGENAPYLHLSLLLNDCIARGKATFEGGVRYLNASSEMFGIISCADSLTAIKTLVYDEKKLFKGSMDKVEVVLKAFYDNDGVQTNLCVIGKDDLENAMVHPENYQNLLVRIGGFSARFVTLNPIVQREIIERTTYGA